MVDQADDATRLAERLAAVASVQRMRIITELAAQPLHVSELARRMQMSRALLYMHLRKLEDADFVRGDLELSAEGKAMNVYTLLPFSVTINPAQIAAAIAGTNMKEDQNE